MHELVELRYGKALTATTRSHGDVPVYGTNGQTGWHDVPLGHGPTVILGRKGMGNLGVEWCEGPFWVIDTAYYVKFKTSSVDPRYFYHFVDYVGLNHLKDGTSNPSLTRHVFERQYMPVPPLDEQRRIAAVLGALDDKIELNRKMNRTLEDMAQAIFQSWLAALDDHAALVRHAQDIIDAGVLEVGDGYRAKRSELDNEGMPFARAGNIDNGFQFEGAEFLGVEGIEQARAQRKLSQPHDVVFTSKGTVGRFAFVTEDVPHFVYSPQLCYWRSLQVDELDPYFLFYWMRSPAFLQQVAAVKGQTDMADYVSLRDQRRMKVLVPPPREQTVLVERLKPLVEKVALNVQESRTLAELRDTLLPRLISGELRVPAAERVVEQAL